MTVEVLDILATSTKRMEHSPANEFDLRLHSRVVLIQKNSQNDGLDEPGEWAREAR